MESLAALVDEHLGRLFPAKTAEGPRPPPPYESGTRHTVGVTTPRWHRPKSHRHGGGEGSSYHNRSPTLQQVWRRAGRQTPAFGETCATPQGMFKLIKLMDTEHSRQEAFIGELKAILDAPGQDEQTRATAALAKLTICDR